MRQDEPYLWFRPEVGAEPPPPIAAAMNIERFSDVHIQTQVLIYSSVGWQIAPTSQPERVAEFP